MVEFEWVVVIAVSSAYVLSTVLLVSGLSAVYNVYRNGPRILPWEPPCTSGLGVRWHYCRRLRGSGVVSKI